jgi:hypothetical protein
MALRKPQSAAPCRTPLPLAHAAPRTPAHAAASRVGARAATVHWSLRAWPTAALLLCAALLAGGSVGCGAAPVPPRYHAPLPPVVKICVMAYPPFVMQAVRPNRLVAFAPPR